MSDYINTLIEQLNINENEESQNIIIVDYAQNLCNAGLPVIFDMKHLSLLLGIELGSLYKLLFVEESFLYTTARIPKKSGGYRTIKMPSSLLKYVQRWILDNILVKIKVSENAIGFIEGKSIKDNALLHVNKKCVLCMDIKDFFPSITYEDVFRIFHYYGYTYSLSNCFAKICTADRKLPQGAPSSPMLSNIRCLKLDKRIASLCEKHYITYSRYADDITLSADHDLDRIGAIVSEIINEEGFKINDKKTRINYSHQRQEVTGLIVNNKNVTVPKEYKRELKKEIYFCKKYGPSNHQKHIKDNHAFYRDHLYGKAYYIKMIEPETGEKLLQELDDINWDN